MAGADQADLVGGLDRRAAPATRDEAAGEHQVDLGGRLDQGADVVGALADPGRQLPEDPLGLLALRARRLRLPVAQLDDLERLDEERLARARRVVDDAGNRAPRARLYGKHGPAAALGDEVLLEVLAYPAPARQPAQLVRDPATALAKLTAQAAELGRGRVLQVGAVGLDAAPDRLGQSAKARVDAGCQRVQQRRLLRLLAERRARDEGTGNRRPDAAQLGGGEHPAAGRALGRGADVLDAVQRRLRGVCEQRDRLGGQRLPARHLG